MRIVFYGGIKDGEEIHVTDGAHAFWIPIMESPRARWYAPDEEMQAPTIIMLEYKRTDRVSRDGAVIFA